MNIAIHSKLFTSGIGLQRNRVCACACVMSVCACVMSVMSEHVCVCVFASALILIVSMCVCEYAHDNRICGWLLPLLHRLRHNIVTNDTVRVCVRMNVKTKFNIKFTQTCICIALTPINCG